MSDALIGLAGVVVGGLLSALVSLVVNRQSNAHARSLAEIERGDRRGAETRARRLETYRELSRLLVLIERAAGLGPLNAFEPGFEDHEWLTVQAGVAAVGSNAVRSMTRSTWTQIVVVRTNHTLLSGARGDTTTDQADRESAVAQLFEAGQEARGRLRKHVDELMDMINGELSTPIADFSRTEAP